MRHRIILLIGVVSVMFTCAVEIVQADPVECPQWVAKVVSVEGRVESLRAVETDWQSAKQNDTICPEDRIRTLANSRAAILLQNESILRLDQKTTVKFAAVHPEKPTLLELIRGTVFFLNRFPRTLTIETPFVNATSEGTEFLVRVDEENQTATVLVLEGRMRVSNETGVVFVEEGQEGFAKAGDQPIVRLVVKPQDAIQWSLYYPPVLNVRELGLPEIGSLSETDWRASVLRSVEFYQAGDLAGAFSALGEIPEEVDNPRFYNYRASLRLAVGRVEEAGSDLEKSLSISPENGHALTLQSIIAVVQNEKDKALDLALKAVDVLPDSVTARMALSYAYQAHFDLSKALVAVQQATKIDPRDAMARARLAELWLAHGELDHAVEAAQDAVSLNPRQSRAHTVLGFAYLTQIRTHEAKEAFMKAIALDQADPMPRLGLGLAKIREGNLAEGRQEIEIAVSLDPNNSLLRSYLGKAYYEEKRDGLAEIQFNMAKELDPKDPTPYLYDAIRKQTINRPVDALHDLQKSIELNKNRAVYRSQLLLDNDQAARSVSLGRIYGDLGFEQAGLVEGWKSVNQDPTNYSAHRFLADSYSTLPRSEIARLSELLVSQLLQPLNNNPVQPRLGESAPAILAGSGPVDPSFNEYSQLFIRDRIQLLLGGVAGEQDTLGEEIIVTGLHGRYSYSLGQFHHETEGWRTNADIDQNLYSVFTQGALTPTTSIQGEIRLNDTESGDIDLRFDPTIFSPTLEKEVDTKTYRLGLHSTLGPESDLLISALYQNRDEDQFEPQTGSTFAVKSRNRGLIIETQYLSKVRQTNIILGAGRFDGKNEIDGSTVFDPPFDIFNFFFESADTIRQTNFYLYSFLQLTPEAILSIGASMDLFKDTSIDLDTDQLNPKLGLIMHLTPSTTLRVAGFRVLTRSLVSDQTIEPTQVAGFQQFFDDIAGTDSKQYGIGIDQKISSDLLGGLEFTYRDLEIPVIIPLPDGTGATMKEKGDYRSGRAYLYWFPFTWLATSAEYYFDRWDQTGLLFHEMNVDRVPLELKVYHPLGFFGKLRSTYIDQEGEFLNLSSATYEPGRDRFWTWDSSLGYRLPNRVGIIVLEAKNILDRRFRFQETDPLNPLIQPERVILIQFTVVL